MTATTLVVLLVAIKYSLRFAYLTVFYTFLYVASQSARILGIVEDPMLLIVIIVLWAGTGLIAFKYLTQKIESEST